MPQSLSRRALKAGLWTVGSHGTELVTRLLSTVILTRLLFPSAFGQIAASTSLIVGLSLISDVGIRTVVLQSPRGGGDDFVRTAWTLKVLRGLAMWLVLILICAIIRLPQLQKLMPDSSAFASTQFFPITVALGLNIIMDGFSSANEDLNMRLLNLKPIYVMNVTARLVSLPVMFAWAWLAPSVWALVGGALIKGLILLILSHAILPGPRMYFSWSRDYVREIMHFGKWINAASVATFVGTQSDRIVLGLLLPASVFGVYAIAKTLTEAAQTLFDRLSAALTLPVLGEVIRRDKRDLKDRYYRFRLPFDCSAPLLGGFLVITGSLIANVLYDARYADAGPLLQIMGISFPIYTLFVIGPVFTANGEPRVAALVSIIRAVALLSFTVIGYLSDGLIGAVVGISIHRIVPGITYLYMGRKRNWIDLLKELRPVPIFIAGMASGEIALAIVRAIHIPIH